MNMDDQIARIVEARMKLRARFLHDVEAMPSITDDRPMGSSTPTGGGAKTAWFKDTEGNILAGSQRL